MTPARFRPGGAVGPDEVYVERRADGELLAALLDAEYCYVLGPTQMGKTSLARWAMALLVDSGFRCAYLDLEGSGSGTPEQWYNTLIDMLAEQLGITVDWSAGPLVDASRTPSDKWRRFLESTTKASEERIVIFVDEINWLVTRPASLCEDFIGSIRAAYNERLDPKKRFRQITFCLLGIASPDDLIRDPNSAPFNVGRAIRLDDFSRAEAIEVFREGLLGLPGAPDAWFDAVYGWTRGHPYMTQRLCWELVQRRAEGDPKEFVTAIVQEVFLADGRASEPNLKNAVRQLGRYDGAMQVEILTLYSSLLQQSVSSVRDDPVQRALYLTGMAAERLSTRGQILAVRNRVFAKVFDRRWVNERLLQLNRPLRDSLKKWLDKDKQESALPKGEERKHLLEVAQRIELTAQEREFVLACENATVRRSFSWWLGVVAGVVVGAMVIVGYTLEQQSRAEERAQETERQRRDVEALAQKFGSQELRSQFLQAIATAKEALKDDAGQPMPEVRLATVKAMLPVLESSFKAIDTDYSEKINRGTQDIKACLGELYRCNSPQQDPCQKTKDDIRNCNLTLTRERSSCEAKEQDLARCVDGQLNAADVITAMRRDLDQERETRRRLEEAKRSADASEQSCRNDLAVCDTARTKARADASQCNESLEAFKATSDAAAATLGRCQANLTTCQTNVVTCPDDLNRCKGDLNRCQNDLDRCHPG